VCSPCHPSIEGDTHIFNTIYKRDVLSIFLEVVLRQSTPDQLHYRLLYRLHGPHKKHMSRVRLQVHWFITSAGRSPDDIENTASPIVVQPNNRLFTKTLSSRELVCQSAA
jgi:hypothetical protein